MKSKVYVTKINDGSAEAKCTALKRIIEGASPFTPYRSGEFVPIKLTIGNTKCIYHISPDLVKILISYMKHEKVKPFLCDTGVIYKGARQNAIDHLTLAQHKGYGHSKVGAPFIVLDGPFGRDGIEYEVNGKYMRTAKVPSLIGMVDSMVVLSHITGHIVSGYAGAIKNIAMGLSSRATKQVQHSSIKPEIHLNKCTSCGCCIEICPADAITLKAGKAHIDKARCIGCGECICACKFDAVKVNWGEDHNIFVRRMVEVANFILTKFKNTFYINFVYDISKECDCISTKDEKIISKDIGIVASHDIVSVDKATVDLINKDGDIFEKENLDDSYIDMIDYAVKIGLGNKEYDLVEL